MANEAAALRRAGRLEEALALYRKALKARRVPAAVWYNYGNLLQALSRNEEAEQAFRQALKLDRSLYHAATNLARLLAATQRPGEAMVLHRRALEIEPRNRVSLRGLAQLCHQHGNLEEAERFYRRVLEITPDDLACMNALGVVLKDLGSNEEALSLWHQVITRDPRHAAAHNNIGVLLRLMRRPGEAVPYLRKALEIDPTDNTTAANLAHALLNLGQTSEAESLARSIIARNPHEGGGHLMLGFTLAYQARIEPAIAACLEAHRLEPGAAMPICNALFSSLYSESRTPAAIRGFHEELATRITPAGPVRTQWAGTRDPDRPLRIGYLSADLRRHPVATFFEPVLAHHDRKRYPVYCYSTSEATDDITERLRGHADVWRDCCGMADAALADCIAADAIDILVDLSGHTAQNRVAALRTRPAPVQALYIGYPGTSGLPEVDYLIADARICPPEHDAWYTERIARLPGSFWCFNPPSAAPLPAPTPARTAGEVTFGSYNALQKLSDRTVRLWIRVLDAVPASRLLLKSLSFADPAPRADVMQRFRAAGADVERITVVGPTDPKDFYAEYRHIDVALDPVPYNGGTTTCEALWMGVPVIALEGDLFRGRMAASILRIIGLPELVAGSEDEYVAIAQRLAGDLAGLQELRVTLRDRMAASPLCDGPRAARELEAAYREMWRAYCGAG